jgi:hypothetical protein
VIKIDPMNDPTLVNLQFSIMQARTIVPQMVQALPQLAPPPVVDQKDEEDEIPEWLPPGQKALMKKQLAAKKQQAAEASSEPPAWLPPGQAALWRKQHAAEKKEQKTQDPQAPNPQQELMVMQYQVTLLYQHAEEQASAAMMACSSAQNYEGETPADLEILTQSANTAAQRAAWAVGWLESTFPASTDMNVESWLAGYRTMIKESCERAGQAAQACIQVLCDMKNRIGLIDKEGNKIKIKVKLKCCHAWTTSRMCAKGRLCIFAHGEEEIGTPQPILTEGMKIQMSVCKFFAAGFCRSGADCQYSHDPLHFAPQPLESKKPVECQFFKDGFCKRGTGCTFAHGPEELAAILQRQAVAPTVQQETY